MLLYSLLFLLFYKHKLALLDFLYKFLVTVARRKKVSDKSEQAVLTGPFLEIEPLSFPIANFCKEGCFIQE